MSTAVHQPAAVERARSRTNSVQRMLELERKIKIEQMQAHGYTDKPRTLRTSSLTARTQIRQSRESSVDARVDLGTSSLNSHQQHAFSVSAKGSRKAPGPGLHITVPQTNGLNHIIITSDQHRSTDTEQNPDFDLESEAASSICQSPSWENYGRRKKERKAQAVTTKANTHKLRKPQPPPSASRTPFLPDRQTTLPLLLGHSKRGRTTTKDEVPKSTKEKESKPKHKRERSESLTRRIRASLEEKSFIGGLKLKREREGPARAVDQDASHDVARSSIRSQATPVRDRPLSGSGHALTAAGGSPPTTSKTLTAPDDRAGSMSTHPLLRHKAAFQERSASRQSSIYGNLDSATTPLTPTLPATDTRREKDRGRRSVTNEMESRSVESAKNKAHHHEDDHDQQQLALPSPKQKQKHSSAADGRRSDSQLGSHEDDSHAQRNSKQGYPPSVPYSTTTAANPAATPTSPTRSRASMALGWPHSTTTATVNSTAPADEARSSRDATRPENRKRQRSSSAMRSFRDAALNVFHRRSSSRARSQTRDMETGRSSVVASTAQQQHTIEASNANYFNQMAKQDEPTIADDLGTEAMKPPPPTSAFDQPSDGDSISSYDTSLSHPSSVTTPNTSRPQSERGLATTGETQKMLSGDENVRTSPWDIDGLVFPATRTPPLGPKSSKRALASHVTNEDETAPGPKFEKAEDEFWSRSAMPLEDDLPVTPCPPEEAEEPVNFSQESLVPQPLTMSPRSSGHVVHEPARPAPSKTQERPQTGGGLLTTTADAEALTAQHHPSLSKSRSNPDLQPINTPFLPKLKHQPLPQSRKPASQHHRNLTSPPALNTQSTTPSTSGPNSAAPAPSVAAFPSPHEKNPASYLESARRAAPARPHRRAGGSSQAGLDFASSCSTSTTSQHGQHGQHVAKVFVECCHCKFYLDMPSRVYECMVQPEGTVEDPDLGVHGVVTRFVKCPWCSHAMTTRCCAGYAAVVYLKEKLH